MKRAKNLTWIVFVLGVWEVLSAFVFMRWAVPLAFWNAFVIGAVMIILTLFAVRGEDARQNEGLEWTIAGFSLWLIVSPFLLAYDALMPLAMWNDVIVGVVSLLLALRSEAVLHHEITAQQS